MSYNVPPSGANKQIQFNDNGLLGTDTLFNWDKTQHRMGIGKTSPNAALDLVGDFFVADAATPTKRYRFQTSGGALDLNAGGAPFILGVFPNGDFTGTFKYYLGALSASHLLYTHGEWRFNSGNAGYDQGNQIFTIHGPLSSGDMVVFNEDSQNYDMRFEGDTDSTLFFLDASTDRIGIGTNTPSEKMHINGNIQVDGDVKITTVGKGIYIKEGTNATLGTATLSSGTVTVNTTKVTNNSRIFLTVDGGTLTNVGTPYVSARTAGTSFTISSTNILDTSNVDWMIIEPA